MHDGCSSGKIYRCMMDAAVEKATTYLTCKTNIVSQFSSVCV